MAKKIIITITDDQDTESCDMVVGISPSMDKETFDKMKKAATAALTGLLNRSWKTFTQLDNKKNLNNN